MRITDLTEPADWYALITPTHGKHGRHIAVTTTGLDTIHEQMAPYLAAAGAPPLDTTTTPTTVLGVPIRIVTDINDDHIEVRHL